MKKFISIAISLLLVLTAAFALVACDNKNYVANNTEHYDDITKTLKLNKEYEGKDFWTDGIARVSVDAMIDGDTTRFRFVNGGYGTITVRYHSVDTPESTGSVEKWGLAASTFTKKQLGDADVIVVEATTNPPTTDTYGNRYLGYVWYGKTGEDLKCLNLELVENGYSENNSQDDPAKYPYYSKFAEATAWAQKIKLRLFSKLEDPLFSDEIRKIDIKEINERVTTIMSDPAFENHEPDDLFNVESGNGARVEFVAYLESMIEGGTGSNVTHTFVAAQYDEETGEIHRINIYGNYSSKASFNMKVGDMYKIVGYIQRYPNRADSTTYQISDIDYSSISDSEGTTFVRQPRYYTEFNSNIADNYLANYSKNFYEDLEVTEVVSFEAGLLTFKGKARQVFGAKQFDSKYTEFTFTIKASSINDLSVGDKLRFGGLTVETVGNSTLPAVIRIVDSRYTVSNIKVS